MGQSMFVMSAPRTPPNQITIPVADGSAVRLQADRTRDFASEAANLLLNTDIDIGDWNAEMERAAHLEHHAPLRDTLPNTDASVPLDLALDMFDTDTVRHMVMIDGVGWVARQQFQEIALGRAALTRRNAVADLGLHLNIPIERRTLINPTPAADLDIARIQRARDIVRAQRARRRRWGVERSGSAFGMRLQRVNAGDRVIEYYIQRGIKRILVAVFTWHPFRCRFSGRSYMSAVGVNLNSAFVLGPYVDLMVWTEIDNAVELRWVSDEVADALWESWRGDGW